MSIYLEPPYEVYQRDKLFDLSDETLNRDGVLEIFARVRENGRARGVEVRTADAILTSEEREKPYYSFGLFDRYRDLLRDPAVSLKGFFLFEPPIVAPAMYEVLPELTAAFETVYVHNTTGDGYSLEGVDQSRLKKFLWPQSFPDVLEPHWSATGRQNRVVVINGNHKPQSFDGELYSKRIRDMAALAKLGVVDLYGRGWDRWWSRSSRWWPYGGNLRSLKAIYKGSCRSKFEVLSRYDFSLCYENMEMDGYLTEKIFDCFYAGAIPLYFGPRDIEKWIDPNTFIDMRRFSKVTEAWDFAKGLSAEKRQGYREAARAFLRGPMGQRYIHEFSQLILAGNSESSIPRFEPQIRPS